MWQGAGGLCVYCVWCGGSSPELGPPLQWGEGRGAAVHWGGMRCPPPSLSPAVGDGRGLPVLHVIVTSERMCLDVAVALWGAMGLSG